MPTAEEEFKRLTPLINNLVRFSLLTKGIDVRGIENLAKEGPQIIVGNHIGSFKDIAILLKMIPYPIFFIANKMIFDKDELNFLVRKHLKRHLKKLGLMIDFIMKPLKYYLVNIISTNINKIGTIPVDIYRSKRLTIATCQDYLKKGRTIILLQGRGRVMKKDPHPYVSPFRKGPSIISYNLYKKERMRIPVTPIAIFGTHKPVLTPGEIKVSIGKSMYITDYLAEGFQETIDRFRDEMENGVKDLFLELIKTS